jgi:hypothetical protein
MSLVIFAEGIVRWILDSPGELSGVDDQDVVCSDSEEDELRSTVYEGGVEGGRLVLRIAIDRRSQLFVEQRG